jgi:hypothetical protein
MKKLTGSVILTAALLTHVAITVATEESYIFSSSDMYISTPAQPAATTAGNADVKSGSPVVAGSLIQTAGFYSVDDNSFLY